VVVATAATGSGGDWARCRKHQPEVRTTWLAKEQEWCEVVGGGRVGERTEVGVVKWNAWEQQQVPPGFAPCLLVFIN